MASGNGNGDPAEKPNLVNADRRRFSKTSNPVSLPRSESPFMEPPPAKKPRLRLNAKSAGQDDPTGDIIAVTRPKGRGSLRSRQSKDVLVDNGGLDVGSRRVSPGVSSRSSSALSMREPSLPKEKIPTSAREAYGDFMSYYVAGGDDDDEPKPVATSKPRSKPKPQPPRQQQLPSKQPRSMRKQPEKPPDPPPNGGSIADSHKRARSVTTVPPQHPSRPQSTLQVHPPYQPPLQYMPPLQHALPPPPPPLIPQPIIQMVDLVYQPRPEQPDTVAVMIEKLERLSTALTNFGGVPPVPQSPIPERRQTHGSTSKPKSNALDTFLANFDDEETESECGVIKPDHQLGPSGASDGPLTYGIQFIMNALRSWAEQRLKHQFTQQFQHQQMFLHQHEPSSQMRRPGRQGKNDKVDVPFQLPAQPVIQLNLAETPEGVAIAAFQAVLDSGCLRTNVVFPAGLTRALRHLYIQIDHLINQGSQDEAPWQCMSYNAQIAAQKTRVDKWKEAHAKALEESARQQHLAQQQVMMQMGLAAPTQINVNAAQGPNAHEVELEKRRSMQHAAQQLYIPQQHLHPLPPPSHVPSTIPIGSVPPPGNIGPIVAHGLQASSAEGSLSNPNGMSMQNDASTNSQIPSAFNKGSAGSVQLDKMKLYMPGFLPRSGQSMKFSFAPHNEAAVRMFGSQAFPPNQPLGPSIPNRGPMVAPPPHFLPPANVSNNFINGANAAGPNSRAPVPNGVEVINLASSSPQQKPASITHPHQLNPVGDHADKAQDIGASRRSDSPEPKTIVLAETDLKGNSSIKLATRRSDSAPVRSAFGNKLSKVSIAEGQGKGADLASKFPRSRAIIVD